MDAQDLSLALSKIVPFLLYPLSVVCLCLGIGVLAPLRPGRRRALAGAALALLLVASCGSVARELGRSLEWQNLPPPQLPHADAIVVLGGMLRPIVYPRTHPELDDSGDRVLHAARLYRAGLAPRIHIAGGRLDFTRTLGAEAPEIAAILGELGVPPEALLLDENSRNTYENAVEARRLLAPLGVARILLVTSAMHMPRAAGLFRHQGFEVVPAPTDFHVVAYEPSRGGLADSLWLAILAAMPRADALEATTGALREWLGIAFYRFRGLLD
jgi:uncharacterized SAM-binding protein YcdF (DUF218 family)